MSALKTGRFFASVAANSFVTQDYVPILAETFKIGVCYGESGDIPQSTCSIIWDEPTLNQLIYTTHQSGIDKLVDTLITGDGVKAVRIKLINNSNAAITMGAGWSE